MNKTKPKAAHHAGRKARHKTDPTEYSSDETYHTYVSTRYTVRNLAMEHAIEPEFTRPGRPLKF